MKEVGLIFLGAFITFFSTIVYRFLDSKKTDYNDKLKLINDLCYNLYMTKRVVELNFNKWVEYHYYFRTQKDTNEKIIEQLMLSNKAEYEKSTMNIYELEAIYDRLCYEYKFIFPDDIWFSDEMLMVDNFNLVLSYDDFESVQSPEELKDVYKRYLLLIDSRIKNDIEPVIDRFTIKLREKQTILKLENFNVLINYWV